MTCVPTFLAVALVGATLVNCVRIEEDLIFNTSAHEAPSRSDFARFDKNNDGVLDPAEVKETMLKFAPSVWTHDRIDALISSADSNQDGLLQLDEVEGFGKNTFAEMGRAMTVDEMDALEEGLGCWFGKICCSYKGKFYCRWKDPKGCGYTGDGGGCPFWEGSSGFCMQRRDNKKCR